MFDILRYPSFIWCVKVDAERIFSGDHNGKIVVHDFWTGRKDEEESSSVSQ